MNRPSPIAFIVGNTVVTGCAVIAAGFAVIAWIGGNAPLMVPIAALGIAAWSTRACSDVSRYRAWHRQWEALAPEQPSPPGPPATAVPVEATRGGQRWPMAIVVASWLCLAAMNKTPDQQSAFVLFTLGILLYGGFALSAVLLRRRRSRAPAAAAVMPQSEDLVALCVALPLYPVTPLPAAYQCLPDYCVKTLRS